MLTLHYWLELVSYKDWTEKAAKIQRKALTDVEKA